MRHGSAIEFALHPVDKAIERGGIRSLHIGWRHHACAELPDDLLSDFCLIGNMVQVQLIEQQIGRLQPGIVARYTVLIEQRPVS